LNNPDLQVGEKNKGRNTRVLAQKLISETENMKIGEHQGSLGFRLKPLIYHDSWSPGLEVRGNSDKINRT
jgi:hypothetical protein